MPTPEPTAEPTPVPTLDPSTVAAALLTDQGHLPTGIAARTMLTVTCIVCGTSYEDIDTEVLVYFDSLAEAVDALDDSGWEFTTAGVLCHHCAAIRACTTHGHDWPPDWLPCRCDGRNPAHTQPMEVRACQRCRHSEQRPARRAHPTAGGPTPHPA